EPEKFDDLWRKEFGNEFIEAINLKNILYNPYVLEISIRFAKKSKTYSQFLYDIITSRQEYSKLKKRLFYDYKKIIIEITKGYLYGN
ncbi:MAG: hypothetical protein QW286_02050, partial [Candidatus Aenigmatarchaeota archaeon]